MSLTTTTVQQFMCGVMMELKGLLSDCICAGWSSQGLVVGIAMEVLSSSVLCSEWENLFTPMLTSITHVQ